MPTSTTKVTTVESDFRETALLGPYVIRTFTTRQYVSGTEGAAPSLTSPGGKHDTWKLSVVPGAYKKYHIYQSPSSAPEGKYAVVNVGRNLTLAIEVVDSLNKATEWTVETTTHPNAYRFSISINPNDASYRWVRQITGQDLVLQHLGTDIDRAAFVMEETSL